MANTKMTRPVNPPSECKKCGGSITGNPAFKGCTCKKLLTHEDQPISDFAKRVKELKETIMSVDNNHFTFSDAKQDILGLINNLDAFVEAFKKEVGR